MDETEELDFDFFDTPRKRESDERENTDKYFASSTPPRAGEHKLSTDQKENRSSGRRSHSQSSSAYSTSESDSYNSEDEKSKEKRKGSGEPVSNKTSGSGKLDSKYKISRDSLPPKGSSKAKVSAKTSPPKSQQRDESGSSSAYSHSDDSDNSSNYVEREDKKTKIEVKMPKAVQAWGVDKPKKHSDEDYSRHLNKNSSGKQRNGHSRHRHRHSSYSSDSESDSSEEVSKHRKSHNSRDRRSHSRSTKNSDSDGSRRHERPSKKKSASRSSSTQSGNSDITSVSSLESGEDTPRESVGSKEKSHRRRDRQKHDSGNRTGTDIKLDSDKIDLSILMKCMADIEKEKQERINANSRKVVFAPRAQKSEKPNYSFTLGRARIIEKENQRLLKQIMSHIHPGSNKLKRSEGGTGGGRPRRRPEPEPIHLVTPSAVNRQVEQRKIEQENRKLLERLQRIKPTEGMSRKEQLKSYERTADFAAAAGILYSSKLYIPKVYDVPDHLGAAGSRPSSATSSKAGRRSRPSSAKSTTSQRSNASTRSNYSVNYASRKSAAARPDNRPAWNDRFAYE